MNTVRVEPTTDKTPQRFFYLLMLGAVLLLGATLWPLATPLFFAATLAGAFWPVQVRLARQFGGRRSLASGVLVLGVILVVVGPVVGFSAFLIKEGTDGARFVSQTVRSEGLTGLISRLPEPLETLARKGIDMLPGDNANLEEAVQGQVSARGGSAAAAVTAALSATGSIVFNTVMMLIALFFFLAEGDRAVTWLDSVVPLRRGQLAELLAEFKKVSFSIIMSTVITSAVQAVAALIGYLIARVPHPVFFAAVTFFVAFIPAVGAGSVCVVAALLLFVTGHTGMAIFLGVWGLVVVGLSDNVVKPLLIRMGGEMNGAVVFFSLLGGLAAFGPVGLLLGPLAVAFFLTLLRIYQRDFRKGPAHSVLPTSS